MAKTTVAMFLDNYDYEETEILTKVGQLLFKSKGQVPYNQGWKVLFESKESTTDKEKEPQLPKVTEGQEVTIDLHSKQKETQPPKRLLCQDFGQKKSNTFQNKFQSYSF